MEKNGKSASPLSTAEPQLASNQVSPLCPVVAERQDDVKSAVTAQVAGPECVQERIVRWLAGPGPAMLLELGFQLGSACIHAMVRHGHGVGPRNRDLLRRLDEADRPGSFTAI